MADEEKRKRRLPHQDEVEKFYNSITVQVAVASIIGANFATNIIEKQIDPYGDDSDGVFAVFELIYNILFTIELGVNMYGHWARPFWCSGWNIFDVVVVTIGIVNTIKLPLPSSFSMLRMMRAFRVFRLFKRVKSLNKIIVAIARAVPGVLNAFLILAIVMSIYAILAVEFYQNVGELCLDGPDSPSRWWMTVRGHCMGQEYFGSFSKSLYTFFQVLTGESWSEMVSRPVIWWFIDDPIRAVGSGLFFCSYVIVTAFVLTNVVVAVLLDKMVDPAEQEAEVEDAGGNGVDGTTPTDEQAPAKPDGNDTSLIPKSKLEAINAQVSKLSSFSGSVRTDLNSARKEMVTLREQIDTILRVVQESSG